MSTGNGAAAIGLANSNKRVHLGPYVQDVGALGVAGPGAENDYLGTSGRAVYDTNTLGEAIDFRVGANSGATTGKTAVWCTNTGTLAAGTVRGDVTTGVFVANNSTGAYDIFFPIPAAGLAANKFFWAFQR